MVRAGTHLAAGALAAAFLLAGAAGAVATADPGNSAASENANNNANKTASRSGAAPSAHSADRGASGNGNKKANANGQSGNAAESSGSGPKSPAGGGPGGAQSEERKPVDHRHCNRRCPDDKTINRAPLSPEAPPPVDLAPVPAPFEAPPPADLPPAIPASPADPDTVDSDASGAAQPVGNEPTVVTVPLLVAPAPLMPMRILGASISARGTTGVLDPTPWSAREASPQLFRSSAGERPLGDTSLTNLSVSAPRQIRYRTGYNEYASRPLSAVAATALPGVGGLVIMTASGICLGYRQAKMAQQLRTHGLDRFLS